MKTLLTTLAAILLSSMIAFAEGIEFFHGTWEEALAEAKKQDRLIFVDGFAVWCGPCKKMAAEVFTDATVGAFYNEHFINVKMDMERGEGLSFRRKYPISAYPTLYYIDYDGKLIHSEKGARPADAFIQLGQTALNKVDRSGQFAEAYEKGDRSPELIYNYVQALNKAGKPSLKIVNDYLRTQKDLTTDQNLRIILAGASEADSKVFDLLIQHRARIAKLESEAVVKDRIAAACKATAKKGIDFQSRDLVDQAVNLMKKHYPDQAEAFALKTEMDYARATDDGKAYARACRDYAKKIAKEDAKTLNEMAQNLIMNFRGEESARKAAEEIAAEAAKQGNTYGYYLTYASILATNGKKEEARKVAEKSMELAKEEGDSAVRNVEMFLQQIQG